MMKKLLCAILIIAIFSLAACGGNADITGDSATNNAEYLLEPTHGGEISLFLNMPNAWCPLTALTESHIQMFNLIFDSLVSVSADMTAIPNLAESWFVSNNGRVWTLQLARDARWHDGSEFTAQDVLYTVNSIRARRSYSIYYQNIQNIQNINVLDAHSLEITLAQPRSNFINLLYFPIIQHQTAAHNPANYVPLGTGAFVFTHPENDETLILTRNHYWHGGNIYVNQVRFTLNAPNQSEFLFNSGQIDMLVDHDIAWGRGVNLADVRHADIPTNRFTFLGLNHRNPALRELSVRQAIGHSVNINGITENILHSRAVASFSPISPNWSLHDSAANIHEFNTARARQILINDGWTLDGDVFTKQIAGVNRRLQFDILVNDDNPTRALIAASIQRTLRDAGIAVNIVSVPFNQYTSYIANRRFDMFIGEYNILADLDFYFMLNSRANPFGLQDAVLDELLLDTQVNSHDAAAAYSALQHHFHEFVPLIGLYYQKSIFIYSSRLVGEPTPLFHNVFFGMENLWIR